jgi:hypothetical protein
VLLQVLGHTKTILVLLTTWLVLHEHMSSRKLMGMVLAVCGMVQYGYFNSSSYKGSSSEESKPLLPTAGKPPPVPARDKLPRNNRSYGVLPDSTPAQRSGSGISGRGNSRSTQDLTAVLTAGAMAAGSTEKRVAASMTSPPGASGLRGSASHSNLHVEAR